MTKCDNYRISFNRFPYTILLIAPTFYKYKIKNQRKKLNCAIEIS